MWALSLYHWFTHKRVSKKLLQSIAVISLRLSVAIKQVNLSPSETDFCQNVICGTLTSNSNTLLSSEVQQRNRWVRMAEEHHPAQTEISIQMWDGERKNRVVTNIKRKGTCTLVALSNKILHKPRMWCSSLVLMVQAADSSQMNFDMIKCLKPAIMLNQFFSSKTSNYHFQQYNLHEGAFYLMKETMKAKKAWTESGSITELAEHHEWKHTVLTKICVSSETL